jgi:hypothetical protein
VTDEEDVVWAMVVMRNGVFCEFREIFLLPRSGKSIRAQN